jgi:hypothetical protein
MIFGKQEQALFDSATACHICEGELKDDRVRDHCHLTGKFRGAAHKICNLKYRVPKFFPVLLHNLTGYDSHLFVKKLRGEDSEKINCIPCNEEKYISFSRKVVVGKYVNKENKEVEVMRELRFLDSLRFMASSLDALSSNLSKDQCKNVGKHYSGKQLDLILRKGVYPYDYVDSIDQNNCTKRSNRKRRCQLRTEPVNAIPPPSHSRLILAGDLASRHYLRSLGTSSWVFKPTKAAIKNTIHPFSIIAI